MNYTMVTQQGRDLLLTDIKIILQEWPLVQSATEKDVNRILNALDEVQGFCCRNQNPVSGSIWDQAYNVIYSTLNIVEKNIKRDIGDKEYQIEAVDIPSDPIEAYHQGFDSGLHSALASIQMTREGSL